MAKKLYTEESIADIADAIREKNGEATKYKVSEMGDAVREIETGITPSGTINITQNGTVDVTEYASASVNVPEKVDVTWHQCPEAVRNFLDNVTYDPSDYSVSHILEYAPNPAVLSNTKPIGKTIDGETFYNEIPNDETPFSTESKAGALMPIDSLRWINTTYKVEQGQVYPMGGNTRDLGGWTCDGGTVKYGMLVRGGEPNPEDRELMVDKIGIRAEVYLLPKSEQKSDESAWGVKYFPNPEQSTYIWYDITSTALWRFYLRAFFDCAKDKMPVYFHCGIGADRTGTIAVMLLALLGVSQSDIDKDYELTNFAVYQDSTSPRRRNIPQYYDYINAIKTFPLASGLEDSFQNRAASFVLSLGFTADEINAFRSSCVDGAPTPISPIITPYSIEKELVNTMIDNTDITINKHQPYEANVKADDGYVISSVQILMGGVDVTEQVFEGQETNLFRSIKKSLVHCSINNNSKLVIDGQSFAAEAKVEDGYTFDGATVQILMGDIDITSQAWMTKEDEANG